MFRLHRDETMSESHSMIVRVITFHYGSTSWPKSLLAPPRISTRILFPTIPAISFDYSGAIVEWNFLDVFYDSPVVLL